MRLGLTMEEAADRAQITRKTWSRLEAGKSVRYGTLHTAERLFGLPAGSVARAYHHGGPFPAPSAPLPPASVPTVEAVFAAAMDLSLADLRRLRDMVDGAIGYTESTPAVLRETS